jgi:polysaccharide chain length determinant protein (PEP-CTERM system associated)
MSNNLADLVIVTLKDTWRNRNLGLIIFIGISLTVLFLSLNWPKVFISSAVVEVDEQNILTPLLEGSAIATAIKDHARNAEQLILSQRSMDKIMQILGDEALGLSDKQKEDLWENIKDNSRVESIGSNLIKISYSSKNPLKAHLLASNLTDLFISESVEEKRRESEGAFQFIADQAAEYHNKLLYSENALKEFRSDNLGADPDSSKVVNDRILELQRSIEQSNLAINEAKIRMENIDAQLSGEAEVSAHLTREGQLQERIDTLQSSLDTLRMTYLDSYPDVIIIKDQIIALKETMKNVRSEESQQISQIQNGHLNPLFQELRAKRSQFKTELAALKTRVKETSQLLHEEMSRARQINNAVAVHAQLTRDYQGNKALYEKLLKQRESARVSMNIDIANQGMTLKVKERAVVPVRPVGMQYIHFFVFGVFGALIAPFGVAFLLGALSGSFKTISALKQIQGLPVLGRIGAYRNDKMLVLDVSWIFFAFLVVAAILSAYIYVGLLKNSGQI